MLPNLKIFMLGIRHQKDPGLEQTSRAHDSQRGDVHEYTAVIFIRKYVY